MKNTLKVNLGERSYPIYIGHNLLSNPEIFADHIRGTQVMVVSNEHVAGYYLEKLLQGLRDFEVDQIILPDGERYKNIDVWSRIFDALLEHGHTRNTTLVALGGGVIGDMTGFAAACYQRGVDFIQVPTTLLSQVDSSVGGKTGVNHPKGKNMIGAFYQPRCVIADTDTLETLDERQFSSGMAEIIKAGLIRDKAFFAWLEDNMEDLLAKDQALLAEAIEQACAIKADVVAQDEREQGLRAILNYGHTFGHAIEQALGYVKWLHGEAVAVGMVLAANVSAELGWIDKNAVSRIENILIAAKLPIYLPTEVKYTKLLAGMSRDKKNIHGQLRLVLLRALGKAELTDAVSLQEVEAMLVKYSASLTG